jgi:hypothetical protein
MKRFPSANCREPMPRMEFPRGLTNLFGVCPILILIVVFLFNLGVLTLLNHTSPVHLESFYPTASVVPPLRRRIHQILKLCVGHPHSPLGVLPTPRQLPGLVKQIGKIDMGIMDSKFSWCINMGHGCLWTGTLLYVHGSGSH